MVYAVKDPILSYFNSRSTFFRGFGVNVHIREGDVSDVSTLSSPPFKFVRVLVSTPDPGTGALLSISGTSTDSSPFAEASFSTDGYIDDQGHDVPSSATVFFDKLTSITSQLIFTFVPPTSWLDPDGYLTGTVSSNAYADYVVAGLLWLRSFGLAGNMLEIFPEANDASLGFGATYPRNLIAIASRIKEFAAANDIADVQLLVPATSTVLPIGKGTDPYIEAFLFAPNSVDIWCMHAIENAQDATSYNSANFAARTYLGDRLLPSVSEMNAIGKFADKYVTRFNSVANAFEKTEYHPIDEPSDVYISNEDGSITPTVMADSQEYCLRIVDNFIGMLSNRASVSVYDSLIDDDGRAIFAKDGSPRLLHKLLTLLAENLPIPGIIFGAETMNPTEDFTIKTLMVSSDSQQFCFLLNRPVIQDNLLGRLRLTVNNSLWDENCRITEIDIKSFPDNIGTADQVGSGVDLSDVVVEPRTGTGSMTLLLKGLPYGGCCIIVTGKVLPPDIAPGPTPSPAPTPSPGDPVGSRPVIMSTLIQIPSNPGSPEFTDYADGTIYYDSNDKVLKVFCNGTWTTTTMLQYV